MSPSPTAWSAILECNQKKYRPVVLGPEDLPRIVGFRKKCAVELDPVAAKKKRFQDEFDPHCLHLLVCSESGEEVACCRMLSSEASQRVGYYADAYFFLNSLREWPLLEVGEDYCSAAFSSRDAQGLLAISLLLFAKQNNFKYISSYSAVCSDKEVKLASNVYAFAKHHQQLTEKEFQIFPHNDKKTNRFDTEAEFDLSLYQEIVMKPLFRNLLELGAKIAGLPAHDSYEHTLNFFLLLTVEEVMYSEKLAQYLSARGLQLPA